MSHQITDSRGSHNAGSRYIVASFRSYSSAAAAMDHLAEQGFPIEGASVVARGLRLVDDAVGRRHTARAAADGAMKGAAVGGLVGVVFGVFTVAEPPFALGLLARGVAAGAVAGVAIGVLDHALRGRRFDAGFSLEAHHYDVVVDQSLAPEAELIASSLDRRDGLT